MKYILGCDIGFGDTKATLANSNGEVIKQFKIPSVIGITQKSEYLNDEKIVGFKGNSYYVGASALVLPSESLIDITDYKNLEYYAPLLLDHIINVCEVKPDVIITGLSKAQIENSGYFKENLKSYEINDVTHKHELIFVLPQGAGSKLCIDKYGDNFPVESVGFTKEQTYVGCDIGFNTLDMFMVTGGKTSANLFEGIEREGIMKIAMKLATKIKSEYNRDITLHEAKEVFDNGYFKARGKRHDMSDFISEVKKDYLRELLALVEDRYGKILDKCDFISLSGGGSTVFSSTDDNFLRVPKSHHEFYNSIGFMLFGLDK